jgi:hypothetical protein
MDVEAAEKIEPDVETIPVKSPIDRTKQDQITVKLRKAVIAHGDLVNELTFRAPTGGDIMALGEVYPIIIDWVAGQCRVNPNAMGQMMSVLAMVPPSTIRNLAGKDWSNCAHALMGFFPPDE